MSLSSLRRCQVYDDNTGIKLTPDAAGLCIVRAIAVARGMIPSQLFLSKSVIVFVADNDLCIQFTTKLLLFIRL